MDVRVGVDELELVPLVLELMVMAQVGMGGDGGPGLVPLAQRQPLMLMELELLDVVRIKMDGGLTREAAGWSLSEAGRLWALRRILNAGLRSDQRRL